MKFPFQQNIFLKMINLLKFFVKLQKMAETVFEIRTLAGSSEHAKRIVDNWKNNATDIYPKIMKALNCEDEENN